MNGKCVLAEGSASWINRRRKQVYESGLMPRQKPHGFKLVVCCGNAQCIAYAHLRLKPWEMFGKSRGGKRA